MKRTLKLKKSSNVHEAHYDPETETLDLHLNDGHWSVLFMDQEAANKFEVAKSHGTHFHQFIKNNEKYEVKRVK